MGILHLDILSGSDLPAADSNGFSDPYCIVSLNGKVLHKTKTHKKTLNPEFDEGIECDVFSRLRSTIFIEVKDHNQFSQHNTLGAFTFPLASIKSEEVVQLTVPLDGKSGKLKLRYLFEPRTLERKYSPLDANDSKLATETSSLGKFGRGLTSQVTGLGSKLLGSKKEKVNAKNASLFVEENPPPLPHPEPPVEKQLPRRELTQPAFRKTSVSASNPTPIKEPSPAPAKEPMLITVTEVKDKETEILQSLGEPTLSVQPMSRKGSNSSLDVPGDKQIMIHIQFAKGLKAADSDGTSDPFVKVYPTTPKASSIFKTSVVKKSLNPIWNEKFPVSSDTKDLKLAVYDKNMVTSSVPLGFVVLDLADLMKTGSFDKEFEIKDGSGIIQISGGFESGKLASLSSKKSGKFFSKIK